LGALRR